MTIAFKFDNGTLSLLGTKHPEKGASLHSRRGETKGDGSYASIGERSMLPENRGDFFRSV